MFERAVLRLVAVHLQDLVPEKKGYQSEAAGNSLRQRLAGDSAYARSLAGVARQAAIGATPAKHPSVKKADKKREGPENAHKAG
jgi:hypothetical protein